MEIQKSEYLANEKSFLDEIVKIEGTSFNFLRVFFAVFCYYPLLPSRYELDFLPTGSA